jgi:hypothetical protein
MQGVVFGLDATTAEVEQARTRMQLVVALHRWQSPRQAGPKRWPWRSGGAVRQNKASLVFGRIAVTSSSAEGAIAGLVLAFGTGLRARCLGAVRERLGNLGQELTKGSSDLILIPGQRLGQHSESRQVPVAEHYSGRLMVWRRF